LRCFILLEVIESGFSILMFAEVKGARARCGGGGGLYVIRLFVSHREMGSFAATAVSEP
jgi:hypothetical protein